MTAWRIVAPAHRRTAFTGDGARRFGSRWNSPGTAVVYTSATVSLAALEMLVHLDSAQLLLKYLVCSVTFDPRLVHRLDFGRLPKNWHADPAPTALRQFGDQWCAAGCGAILQVPSSQVHTESNFLLNPRHPDFRKLKFGSFRRFEFGPRLA